MIYKEIEGVLVTFTLTTRVTGLRELQSETSDRDPRSSFMTESAWPTWGIPSLPTYVSVCLFEPFDRLGKPDGLSRWRSRFGFFQVSLGDAESYLRVVFVAVENVIVEFVGESSCEQFFVSMNTSVLLL